MGQTVFPRDDNGAVYTGGKWTHINANGNTPVKSGAGFLHRVTVGTAGTAWNLTLYDGTDATGGAQSIIGVVNGAQEGSYELDIEFTKGLYIVAAGTTAGDVTISSI